VCFANFRLGLEVKKEENLPDWYSQVVLKFVVMCDIFKIEEI
jgi:hypothetical protein